MNTTKCAAAALIFLAAAVAPLFGSSPAFAGDAATAGQAPDPMQIARGAKEWSENCGRCHNIRDPKEYSDKNWDLIVSQMRVRAMLPGQVADDILAFLKASN